MLNTQFHTKTFLGSDADLTVAASLFVQKTTQQIMCLES